MEDVDLKEKIASAQKKVQNARREIYSKADKLPYLIGSLRELAMLRRQAGDKARAESLYKEAIGHIKEHGSKLKESRFELAQEAVELHSCLAFLCDETDRSEIAQVHYQEALKNAETAKFPPSCKQFAVIHNNLAMVCKKLDKKELASTHYKTALQILKGQGEECHREVADVLNNIGVLQHSCGEHHKAIYSHKEALELRRGLLEADHPDLAQSYYNMAAAYKAIGDKKSAQDAYNRGKQIQDKKKEASTAS